LTEGCNMPTSSGKSPPPLPIPHSSLLISPKLQVCGVLGRDLSESYAVCTDRWVVVWQRHFISPLTDSVLVTVRRWCSLYELRPTQPTHTPTTTWAPTRLWSETIVDSKAPSRDGSGSYGATGTTWVLEQYSKLLKQAEPEDQCFPAPFTLTNTNLVKDAKQYSPSKTTTSVQNDNFQRTASL
jgi:hypothetical protein